MIIAYANPDGFQLAYFERRNTRIQIHTRTEEDAKAFTNIIDNIFRIVFLKFHYFLSVCRTHFNFALCSFLY